MKFCQPHWDKLRAAIDDRGLSGLVAKDGAQAIQQMADQLARVKAGDESLSASNFDPLMSAHWAIVNNALRICGLAIMAPNEDGSARCPLCFMIAGCSHQDCPSPDACGWNEWINRAADDAKTRAVELGLVGQS